MGKLIEQLMADREISAIASSLVAGIGLFVILKVSSLLLKRKTTTTEELIAQHRATKGRLWKFKGDRARERGNTPDPGRLKQTDDVWERGLSEIDMNF